MHSHQLQPPPMLDRCVCLAYASAALAEAQSLLFVSKKAGAAGNYELLRRSVGCGEESLMVEAASIYHKFRDALQVSSACEKFPKRNYIVLRENLFEGVALVLQAYRKYMDDDASTAAMWASQAVARLKFVKEKRRLKMGASFQQAKRLLQQVKQLPFARQSASHTAKVTIPLPDAYKFTVDAIPFTLPEMKSFSVERDDIRLLFLEPLFMLLPSLRGVDFCSIPQVTSTTVATRCSPADHAGAVRIRIPSVVTTDWVEISLTLSRGILVLSPACGGGVVYDVLFLFSGFRYARRSATDRFAFSVSVANDEFLFEAPTREECEAWLSALDLTYQTCTNSSSFAPPQVCNATWFIDGKDYFAAVLEALRSAQETIFIADWFITPELYLSRDGVKSNDSRLDFVLLQQAERGVDIFVLLWHETSVAVKLESRQMQKKLESLHPRVRVLTHPDQFPVNWSHHQKLVVCDQRVAFIGGLDLCIGRYDTPDHVLFDPCELSTLWPGKDYYNPTFCGIAEPHKPFCGELDRAHVPRMPWHDVHMRVDGATAWSAAANFAQRWNHHRDAAGSDVPYLVPRLGVCINVAPTTSVAAPATAPVTAPPAVARRKKLTLRAPRSPEPETVSPAPAPLRQPSVFSLRVSQASVWNPAEAETPARGLKKQYASGSGNEKGNGSTCTCQVLRSIAPWSGGYATEASVLDAYLRLIKRAKHLIYIENQYFVSSLAGGGVRNKVAEALWKRIALSVASGEPFKVVIVLPTHPEGDIVESLALQYVMYWQRRTISDERGLLGRFRKKFPVVDPSRYITFHTLRNWGVISGRLITNQIYVHSKLMLVDDQYAIVGSANINDRSLLGDRDSELCVCVGPEADAEANAPSSFVKSLRKALWTEHLGLTEEEAAAFWADDDVERQHSAWCEVSRSNSATYEVAFPRLTQSSTIHTWADYTPQQRVQWPVAHKAVVAHLTATVKGHVLDFPHDFLRDVNLGPFTNVYQLVVQ
eukprot:TRINITY_DN749_c0_g1_i3.p1 TRINITY_DN749_c0_g1~~TRINITY_DN749_c0_g1_i3.p1  ORF type:complete len:990 (-),score=196.57 TRINITY_DN749_c0_g1_i3:39-3008(-)